MSVLVRRNERCRRSDMKPSGGGLVPGEGGGGFDRHFGEDFGIIGSVCKMASRQVSVSRFEIGHCSLFTTRIGRGAG